MQESQNLTQKACVNQLRQKLCDNIGEILEDAGLQFRYSGNYWYGPCPIHGGDNEHGCSICVDGDYKGTWRCWTRNCEEEIGRGIDKFVGAISKVDVSKLKTKPPKPPQKRYNKKYSRQIVRTQLEIPAQFYLDKGYSPDIIDRYDIGYAHQWPLPGRVVCPVYNELDECVGFTGRALNGEQPKWKHSGFASGKHLYNIHFAKDIIHKTRTVYLVESIGNLLRLVDNGLENVLAVFGSRLNQTQAIKLETYNVKKIVMLFDNDQAGQKGMHHAKKYTQFDIIIPDTGIIGDIGDLSNSDTKQLIEHILK